MAIPLPFDKFWERLPYMPNLVDIVDNLLNPEHHEELMLYSQMLEEDLPEKDWRTDRPGLLELVDPFLYCFISEVTGKKLPSLLPFQPPCMDTVADRNYSQKFQLLPTNFYVEPDTKKVVTLSYINNLDPREYREIYTAIERVVEGAVPHFEKVLSELIGLDVTTQMKAVSLVGRPLQIIVSMKNIYLTPKGTSKYGGSSWHIEGFKNERIVASAIFYYDVENISESQLAFQFQTGENSMSALGHTTATSNRLVVFPNVYEHIVRPFELDDGKKPGHRKFITLFLVDPDIKIVSTEDVAPQQETWYPITGDYSCDLFRAEGKYLATATMTIDKAKSYRVAAAKERKGGAKPIVKDASTTTTPMSKNGVRNRVRSPVRNRVRSPFRSRSRHKHNRCNRD